MFPILTVFDASDLHLTDAIYLCQRRLGRGSLMDFHNLFFREFCAAVTDAGRCSPGFYHVLHIVLICSGRDVLGVYALSIVTSVPQVKALWNRPNQDLVDKSVSKLGFTIAVRRPVASSPGIVPQPAVIGPIWRGADLMVDIACIGTGHMPPLRSHKGHATYEARFIAGHHSGIACAIRGFQPDGGNRGRMTPERTRLIAEAVHRAVVSDARYPLLPPVMENGLPECWICYWRYTLRGHNGAAGHDTTTAE